MAFEGIELRTFDTFGIEPSASYSFLRDLRRAKAASIAEADAAQRRRRDAGATIQNQTTSIHPTHFLNSLFFFFLCFRRDQQKKKRR